MSIRVLAISTAVLIVVRGVVTVNLPSIFSLLNSTMLRTLLPKPSHKELEVLASLIAPEDYDADLNFTQIAAKYGHPAQEYVVYTEDAYRLKVFRLPGKEGRLPVLLFHGLIDSSDTWIIRGNRSLAINLANAGYDVWLGNVRGNKHSLGHLSPRITSNYTYWDFSFHEHGIYDLPATIDLVLRETGHTKLNAIGHSQGTTIHFVLLSTRPEYNEKVNMLIALAPVAYLHSSPPSLADILRALPLLYKLLRAVHRYELFGDTSPERALIDLVCSTPATAFAVCLKFLEVFIAGSDAAELEPEFSLVVIRHFPTATSVKNVYHFSQVATRKTFANFDYGINGNLEVYNSTAPPVYDLSKVTSQMVLLTAKNDFLSTQPDVAILRRQLPNVVKFVVNPRAKMNHLDYVWGRNMKTYVFPYIFRSLQKYTNV